MPATVIQRALRRITERRTVCVRPLCPCPVAAEQLSAKFYAVNTEEVRAFSRNAEQVRAAGNLGDRPLVVLTAGKAEPLANLPQGATLEDLQELRSVWVDELQIGEMHLSTRGKRIIVADSCYRFLSSVPMPSWQRFGKFARWPTNGVDECREEQHSAA